LPAFAQLLQINGLYSEMSQKLKDEECLLFLSILAAPVIGHS